MAKSVRQLENEVKRKELEIQLAEANYATTMLQRLTNQEAIFNRDADERGWLMVSSGGGLVDAKTDPALQRDPQEIRRRAYIMWRTNPHARGIIRTFEKFIIGKEFAIDFADTTKGTWNKDKTKLVQTNAEDAPLMIQELWEDFADNNRFINRMKELVRRSFRDGGAFLRKYNLNGFIVLRFIEPERIYNPDSGVGRGKVEEGDVSKNVMRLRTDIVGKPTTIIDGIEYLADDTETVVAYHVQKGQTGTATERVPAKDVLHTKPLADTNDLRGLLLLESVMRHLTNYAQWEEYRLVLNKMRTAVALVRRVDGTAAQARGLIDGRSSPFPNPKAQEPVTQSGRRESMLAPGTIITAGPGVDWDFKAPNLGAGDAERDGRRILLSVAAGMSLPEMLVTGDWSNSNYSSSVESRTPAVREWEDWQQFFEPYIKQIINWVIEAAQESLGLPEDIDTKATIQWPQLIAKDSAKETNRNAVLREHGVISPQTWCAREDLVYADEIENMKQAAEDAGYTLPGEAPADQAKPTEPPGGPGGAAGANGGGGGNGGARAQQQEWMDEFFSEVGDDTMLEAKAPLGLTAKHQKAMAAARKRLDAKIDAIMKAPGILPEFAKRRAMRLENKFARRWGRRQRVNDRMRQFRDQNAAAAAAVAPPPPPKPVQMHAAGSGKMFPAGATADARVTAAQVALANAQKAGDPAAIDAAKRELRNANEFAFKRARKGRKEAQAQQIAGGDVFHACVWRTINGHHVCIKGGHDTQAHGPRVRNLTQNVAAARLAAAQPAPIEGAAARQAAGLPPGTVSPSVEAVLLRRAAWRRAQGLRNMIPPADAQEAREKANRHLERERLQAERQKNAAADAAQRAKWRQEQVEAQAKRDAEWRERQRKEAEERAKPQSVPADFPPGDEAQQALAAKVVVEVKGDKGGINDTYKVTFADGTKAKWKPQDGEKTMGAWDHQGMQWRREVNAYAVAKVVGLTYMRPAVAARTINGRLGAVLQWIGGNVAADLGRDKKYDGELGRQQVSMFDVMIGNGDRHHGNWIVENGEMRMIDHGFSMPPNGRRGIRTWPIQRNDLDQPIPEEVRAPWRGKKDELIATMKAHQIEDSAIKLFEKRYDAALSPDVVSWNDMKKAMQNVGFHMELNG